MLVLSGDESQLTISLEKLYRTLNASNRRNVFIHVVLRGKEFYYPGNLLRNIAADDVETEFSFLNDGDFLPSTNTEASLAQYKHQLQQKQVCDVAAPNWKVYH